MVGDRDQGLKLGPRPPLSWEYWLERSDSGALHLFCRRRGAPNHIGFPITINQLENLLQSAREHRMFSVPSKAVGPVEASDPEEKPWLPPSPADWDGVKGGLFG